MNHTFISFKKNTLTLGALLLMSLSTGAQADSCAKVEVLNNECNSESLKVSLESCQDEVLALNRVRCEEGKISFTVRGAEKDYKVTVASEKGAWGAQKWNVIKEKVIEHRPTAKTLPKGAHERKDPSPISIEIPSKDAGPNEPKVDSIFQFSGYFDAYYSHNFNRPGPTDSAAANSQNNLRFYDFYSNQPVLNLAEFTIKHIRKETSFVLDLDFGQFADLNAQVPTLARSGGPSQGTVNETTRHIGQAVLTYTPAAAPNWLFEIGKMPTHVGLELMKAKDNWNYSRSTLFTFGGPFWHTGAHVGYSPLPGYVTIGLYAYNGWGTVYDTNSMPTYGFQFKWTPTTKLTWVYNYIGGPEVSGNNSNWKQIHESNFSYTINRNITFAADVLYGHEKGAVNSGQNMANWYGAQAGIKWQTTPKAYFSPRVELFRDPQGYALTGVPSSGTSNQTLQTYTLTESFLVSEGFELRIEGRYDRSNQVDRFIKNRSTSKGQLTALMGILYTM